MGDNDYTNLKKYSKKWIAINDVDGHKVIASGRNLKEVLNISRKKGVENPTITKAPDDYGTFIL